MHTGQVLHPGHLLSEVMGVAHKAAEYGLILSVLGVLCEAVYGRFVLIPLVLKSPFVPLALRIVPIQLSLVPS